MQITLKNSKFRCNWVFKIIIGSYNLIFLISDVLWLVCVFYFILFYFWLLCCILEPKAAEGWFFQRAHLCTWSIGGHELDTLNIWVNNSLTVHDNPWALEFDNFSEFKTPLVIAPTLHPIPQRHYDALPRKIDTWLIP